MEKICNVSKQFSLFLIVFGAALLLWEISVVSFNVPQYLVPAPREVMQQLISKSNILVANASITMLEAIGGFLLGSIVGIVTAILFVHFKVVELALLPYAVALKTVPIIALAPLLVLWFGNGILAKIIIAALISYFPVIVNTAKGLKSVNNESLDLMKSLSASKLQIFLKLRFPSALPYIFSALKISATLSVIGAIVGELAGATQGIGYLILTSSYRIETTMVFASIIISSLTSISFFVLIILLEKKIIYWQTEDSGRR